MAETTALRACVKCAELHEQRAVAFEREHAARGLRERDSQRDRHRESMLPSIEVLRALATGVEVEVSVADTGYDRLVVLEYRKTVRRRHPSRVEISYNARPTLEAIAHRVNDLPAWHKRCSRALTATRDPLETFMQIGHGAGGLVTLCFAVLCTLAAAGAHAALVSVELTTNFGERPGGFKGDSASGVFPSVSRSLDSTDPDFAATAHASAAAEGVPQLVGPGSEHQSQPRLRASASGTKFDDGMFLIGGGGGASATWSDALGLGSELLVDPATLTPLGDMLRLLNPILWFPVHVSGTISNRQGASMGVSVVPADLSHATRDEIVFEGPTSVDQVIALHVPLFDLNGPDRAQFFLSLTVGGGTDLDGNDGTTDFSSTVELLPLFITDPKGNPIPGTDNVQILGELGNRYPMSAAPLVTTVPEPAGYALLATAAALAVLTGRRRTRRQDAR